MMMMTKRMSAAALLASTMMICPLGIAMAAEGAISDVTLSSGGLAEVVRSAPAAGGQVAIEVPLDQVDDVLKSLVVIGGTGSVRQLSLGGLSPVEEVMRRMPFSAEDMAGLPTLLGRLQGVRVEAEGGGRKLEGIVLGVSVSRGENGAESHVLSLMGDNGATVAVPLSAEVEVRILDAAVLAKIAEAASAIGRAKADGARTIEITIDAPAGATADPRVDIAYVVAAPIWKTAYRVVSDPAAETARLQAWAVVENATGEDWDGVTLKLASGSPVTLKQRLFERYWRERQEVPVDVAGIPAPRPDAGEMDAEAVPAAPVDGRVRMLMAPKGSAARAPAYEAMQMADAAGTVSATATEGDVSASFAVPGAIDLKAGETLSVPIVDETVAAERVSLFQPAMGGVHPVAALLLSNQTEASLPPGILTVYDGKDGYLGDAQLLGMPAGDQRMVSFALDRKVRIDSAETPTRVIVKLTAADGVLKADVRSRNRTVYTIDGAEDGARDVVIEHPRLEGWTLTSNVTASLTETAHRLRTRVEAGESTTVEAVQERLEAEVMTLTDADPDLLVSWASQAEGDDVRDALTRIADARRQMVETEQALTDLEQGRERIERGQDRIRRNLQAVPETSELAKGYLADMAEQEEALDGLEAKRRDLDAELGKRRDALAATIRAL